MKLKTILAGAGVLAALALATSASAANVGTYNLGILTASGGLSQAVTGDTGAIDDIFNFSINPPPLNSYGQLIDFAQTGQSGVFAPGATIGLFTSGGVAIGPAQEIATLGGLGSLGDTLTERLGPGSYYVEVVGTAADSQAINYGLSIFGAAVPEPAAWAMMIVGLGLIGSTLRVRARREQGVAA